MFTNKNVISARYTNAENDTAEVLYGEDGTTRAYIFPARPTRSKQWSILKEAEWTVSKVKDQTVEWIKDQKRLQYQAAFNLAEELKKDAVEGLQKDYDTFVQKTNDEMRKKYDSAVTDMSAKVRTDASTGSSIYDAFKENNSERLFEFKVAALEDKEIFAGKTKTAEKTLRREIRKCQTFKELIALL